MYYYSDSVPGVMKSNPSPVFETDEEIDGTPLRLSVHENLWSFTL